MDYNCAIYRLLDVIKCIWYKGGLKLSNSIHTSSTGTTPVKAVVRTIVLHDRILA